MKTEYHPTHSTQTGKTVTSCPLYAFRLKTLILITSPAGQLYTIYRWLKDERVYLCTCYLHRQLDPFALKLSKYAIGNALQYSVLITNSDIQINCLY